MRLAATCRGEKVIIRNASSSARSLQCSFFRRSWSARSLHTTGNAACGFNRKSQIRNRERLQQTEYEYVADREVGDHEQRAIAPQRRTPCRKRVDAERGRASDEDLDPMAGPILRWTHAASAARTTPSGARADS